MTDDLQKRMQDELQSGAVFDRAALYAKSYAAAAHQARVVPDKEALAALEAFDTALPDSPNEATEIVDQLHNIGAPASVAQIGGRWFGLVNGGAIPAALGARMIGDVWDQNAALWATSPVNAKLEEIVERWLIELFGLPQNTIASYVSGTSMATVCGLAAARWRLLQRAGWDVNERGLDGAPRLRIVTGRHAHGTVVKAVKLLGFGTDRIEWMEVDEQGRVIAENAPDFDDQTIVILQAGNVNSGAFDPLRALCEKANNAGAWVHIDGAFGLWAAASPRLHHLTDGLELAQSWSVDGHKTLNAPYDNGISLCSDEEALIGALQNLGAYIAHTDNRDGMLYTPDMSRRARAIDLWASLAYLGRQGIDELVYGLHARAREFAQGLRAEGFDILNDVVFNQALTAGDTDAETQSIIEHIQQSGEAWVGGSSWFERNVIRISVCSWATTSEDVARSIRAFVVARERLRA